MSHIRELSCLRLVLACHGSHPSVHCCFSLATEGVKHETKALSEQAYLIKTPGDRFWLSPQEAEASQAGLNLKACLPQSPTSENGNIC